MTPEFWQRVASLFVAATDLAPADWPAFLERKCAGDASLFAQVIELLEHDRESDREGFLDGAGRRPRPPPEKVGPVSEPDRQARHIKVVRNLESGNLQTTDFEGLLRQRMHVSGWILFFGSSALLVKNVGDGTYNDLGNGAILCAQFAVVLTAALAVGVLRSRRNLTLRTLRVFEWALLGVITCFFSLFQLGQFRYTEWGSIATAGHYGDVLDLTAGSTMLPWFALIVGYGLVIPNTWWRCTRVVFGIALFPSAVILGVGYWEGTLGQLMDAFQEMLIWLGIALAIAVYGSHKITQLTCQANAARRFGHYELKRLLGSGGMGEVYLAEHALLKRPCAIKLIRSEKAGDAATQERFAREVRAIAKLKHSNVVEIYDYGRTDDGQFYYVMEHLSGPTLEQLISARWFVCVVGFVGKEVEVWCGGEWAEVC